MPKPVVNQINPFDGNKDHTLSFSWHGDQSYKNRCIIYDAETMAIIFDHTVATFALEQTIPAFTLENGKQWIIQFQSYDKDNIESPLSDKIYFFTFSKPSFYFSNLSETSEISNTSYTVSVVYDQNDFEELASYKFYLYDSAKTVLIESDNLYNTDDISYTFRGLENNTKYYMRCNGVTVNRMEVDTGYTEVFVKYENPSVYGRIFAENDKKHGYVKYNTNIIIIQYDGDKVYEYVNGKINLIDNEIVYNSGFNITGDFTCIIRGINLWQTATIFEAQNKSNKIVISSVIYDTDKLRFRLLVPNAVGSYIKYSDPVFFTDDDMVTIWVRRVNDIYDIQIFVNEDFSALTDIWFGNAVPKGIEKYEMWIENGEPDTFEVKAEDFEVIASDVEPTTIRLNSVWIGD